MVTYGGGVSGASVPLVELMKIILSGIIITFMFGFTQFLKCTVGLQAVLGAGVIKQSLLSLFLLPVSVLAESLSPFLFLDFFRVTWLYSHSPHLLLLLPIISLSYVVGKGRRWSEVLKNEKLKRY